MPDGDTTTDMDSPLPYDWECDLFWYLYGYVELTLSKCSPPLDMDVITDYHTPHHIRYRALRDTLGPLKWGTRYLVNVDWTAEVMGIVSPRTFLVALSAFALNTDGVCHLEGACHGLITSGYRVISILAYHEPLSPFSTLSVSPTGPVLLRFLRAGNPYAPINESPGLPLHARLESLQTLHV